MCECYEDICWGVIRLRDDIFFGYVIKEDNKRYWLLSGDQDEDLTYIMKDCTIPNPDDKFYDHKERMINAHK